MAEQESRGNERHVLVLTNQSKPHIPDVAYSLFSFIRRLVKSEDVTDVDGDKSERCLLKETSETSVESGSLQHLPSLYFYLDDEFSLLGILPYSLSGCHKRQHLRNVVENFLQII
ncbi:hypothetical protein T01_16245 [Trichinella spiralis]|uniref:Uncharacterized protein n=1 Tax=Trichinella spiralis TaxID=6334 RepID=A0A0V1BSA9_TRISP|nr:hypothetical protein T01_16245 [Trichinella spiralis]